MVLKLGGCGRVGDCRNNFLRGGPCSWWTGPFLVFMGAFLFVGGVVVCPLLCQGRGARDGFCVWDTPTVCGPGGRWQAWPFRPLVPMPTHRHLPVRFMLEGL